MTSNTTLSDQSILLIKCTDRPGLISSISGAISKLGANILSNQEFVSIEGVFFMRTRMSGSFSREKLESNLRQLLPDDSSIHLREFDRRKLIILATKEAHCLGDLLIRHYSAELNADIVAVVSNHDLLRGLVESFGIPFHFIAHQGVSREVHEERVKGIIEQYDVDYLILAKYMRILTPAFIDRFSQRIINIHHSFLPAFIGANPYRQAYNRGVKIIGATSHLVTSDLDEGPIIAQSVIPVTHRYSPKDMAQSGRDVEKTVLAKAVKLVLEDRVMVDGNKTIVFE